MASFMPAHSQYPILLPYLPYKSFDLSILAVSAVVCQVAPHSISRLDRNYCALPRDFALIAIHIVVASRLTLDCISCLFQNVKRLLIVTFFGKYVIGIVC